MSDLFGIGASGVNAYRTALSVVGDNVANADTPGYVRRTVELRATSAGGAGSPIDRSITVGSGTRVAGISRAADALKATASRAATSDLARVEARAEWLTRLQSSLGSGDASLAKQIGGFFDAAQDLTASPASTPARAIFLDRADATAAAFRSTAVTLDNVAADLTAAVGDAVTQVNRLTTSLATINTAMRASGAGGDNALLDERDRALAELAAFVRIGVSDTGRGTVEVRLGDAPDAPLLVTGADATRIDVRDGTGGSDVVLDPTHSAVTVRLPASGSLAGLIEASRRVTTTSAAIDALATRFAASANSQHRAGVDADGNDGGDLFATATIALSAGRANAGAAAIDVRVADGAIVDPGGYLLGFDGGAWSLSRSDGTAIVSGPATLVLDGLTVTPSGMARAGDRFALAERAGAAGIALRAIAPREVAAASRWLTDAAGGNVGSGRIAVATDDAAISLPPLVAYRIVVTGATTADIVDPMTSLVIGAASIDGASIAGAGFSLALTGAPAVGDSFRIVRNADGIGDNGNVRALVALRDGGGSGNTMEATLDATIGGVASAVLGAVLLATTARAVRDDAARMLDATTGIDLDQEAAELVRLQAAYKANAQVIAAARELFDSLLQAVA